MTKLIIVHPALIEKTYLQGRWQGRESHQPLSQDTLYIVWLVTITPTYFFYPSHRKTMSWLISPPYYE